jgi:hypothetical protein
VVSSAGGASASETVSATVSAADSAAAVTVSIACVVAIAAASIIVSLDSPVSPLDVLKVSLNSSDSMPGDPFSGMGDFIALMIAHPLPSLRTTVAPPLLENPAFVTYPLSSSTDSKVENPPPVGTFFKSPMKKVDAK